MTAKMVSSPRVRSFEWQENGASVASAPSVVSAASVAELSDSQLLKRFARKKDEAAFEALVHRHGPMVLGVCQRILKDWHEAEDAFQATFLVLARKARAIGRPELLGNWLYGVAYRTSLKAKDSAVRRNENERQVAQMTLMQPREHGSWRDLQEMVDEELEGLPAKYRAPLVLCYLQGKTNEEAARVLGWPSGSMSGRLARGRELLRERLSRRHSFALAPGTFPAVLAQSAAPGTLPAPLVATTVKAALSYTAGKAAAAVSPSVAALVGAVLRALWLRQCRWAAGVLLAVVVAIFGSGLVAYGMADYFGGSTPPGPAHHDGCTPQDGTGSAGGTALAGCGQKDGCADR